MSVLSQCLFISYVWIYIFYNLLDEKRKKNFLILLKVLINLAEWTFHFKAIIKSFSMRFVVKWTIIFFHIYLCMLSMCQRNHTLWDVLYPRVWMSFFACLLISKALKIEMSFSIQSYICQVEQNRSLLVLRIIMPFTVVFASDMQYFNVFPILFVSLFELIETIESH